MLSVDMNSRKLYTRHHNTRYFKTMFAEARYNIFKKTFSSITCTQAYICDRTVYSKKHMDICSTVIILKNKHVHL